eukprot:612489_1
MDLSIELYERYMFQLVSYSLMTIILMMLLITSIIQFRGRAKVSTNIKYSYFFVMINANLVFIIVAWYGIADFIYDFAALSQYCNIAAIVGGILMATYFYSLYLFFSIRLYSTFINTPFRLTTTSFHSLLAISTVVYIGFVISIIMLQEGEVLEVPFAWSGQTHDEEIIVICAGEFSIGLNEYIRIGLQVVIVISNIFYGLLFYNKLYLALKEFDAKTIINSPTAVHKSRSKIGLVKIYAVMKKQTNLMFICTISTIVFCSAANGFHFFGFFLQILIYIDIFVNCICLWLMFEWNDKYYQRYCKLCIICNNVCCFKLAKKTALMKTISGYKIVPKTASGHSLPSARREMEVTETTSTNLGGSDGPVALIVESEEKVQLMGRKSSES